MKDISFIEGYAGYDQSKIIIKYGDKEIITVKVWDDDVIEVKAIALAIQGEIMKDIINKTATS